ncbi:MAG: hypothetical protein A2340_09820 [Lentisphaerae bacterium RIFOXYB12_FULL_60_10]|nr:MAG: hypothetical protein A2340_09820 [Lentisphaerae bacterium RIFOXYB12_FULL_60_10]
MYLDSAILVKLVVREPDSEYYADLVDGQRTVTASELVVAECRSALLRKCRQGEIDTRTCDQSWERLQAYWDSDAGGLILHPVSRIILEEAGEVIKRCIARVSVRTLDAIHLASCRLTRDYPLITTDHVMRAAAESMGLPLGDLPHMP